MEMADIKDIIAKARNAQDRAEKRNGDQLTITRLVDAFSLLEWSKSLDSQTMSYEQWLKEVTK